METILKNIAIPVGEGRSTEPLPGETVFTIRGNYHDA